MGKENEIQEKTVEEKPKVEEPQGKYSLAEVSTASEIRITDGEKVYTQDEAIVLLLNDVRDMKKKIVG